MSGTLGAIRKQKAERERQRLKALEQSRKQAELQVNREAVIAEVCALFGWKELDPFAKEMIDKAFAGQIVDIKQLKADIADWLTKQSEPEGSEETEDADISLHEN
jgi:hypothetical protein